MGIEDIKKEPEDLLPSAPIIESVQNIQISELSFPPLSITTSDSTMDSVSLNGDSEPTPMLTQIKTESNSAWEKPQIYDKCIVCARTFKNPNSLEKHLRNVHTGKEKSNLDVI